MYKEAGRQERQGTGEEEEEAKAMNEVDAGRDRATPASGSSYQKPRKRFYSKQQQKRYERRGRDRATPASVHVDELPDTSPLSLQATQ